MLGVEALTKANYLRISVLRPYANVLSSLRRRKQIDISAKVPLQAMHTATTFSKWVQGGDAKLFWGMKPADRMIKRNPRFASAFRDVYNGLMMQWGAKERFDSHISGQGIIDQIEKIYISTKAAAEGVNGGDVFASVGVQLMYSITEKAEEEQFAWSVVVARDVIFGYGPALANARNKDVNEVTRLLLGAILEHVSKKNASSEQSGPMLIFGAILEQANR